VGGVLTSKVLGATETLGGFGISGVGKNQIGNPIVSPGRLSVETYGGPNFPNEERYKVPQEKGFLHWYSQDSMPLSLTRPKVHQVKQTTHATNLRSNQSNKPSYYETTSW
jgi:hypothetical protein